MQLSRNERLVLANQYRILKALVPEEAEYYDKALKIVESGFESEYENLAQNVYSVTLSRDECTEVRKILGMYSDLGYGYGQLSDKSGIEPYSVTFPGFDGNNEGAYLDFAEFIKEDPSMYHGVEVKNSHGPFLESMRRMLVEWEKCENRTPLTRVDILAITSAAVHPSNRK